MNSRFPVFLASLKSRPNVHKILTNISWLMFDKGLRLGVGLFVGAWAARYLGPAQYGSLNFAIAFVSMFSPIASLGLNSVVVRDMVRNPGDAEKINQAAFFLHFCGSLLASIVAVLLIGALRAGDDIVVEIVYILVFSSIFRCTDVIKYWYESQVRSRIVVWIERCIFLLGAAIKVFLILSQAELLSFVWIFLFESLLVSVVLLFSYFYSERKVIFGWTSIERLKNLLKDSFPLMLSGIAIIIYMRVDQIMLGSMLSDKEVGVYSAALRISEVWYILPMVITSSLFPGIVILKEKDSKLYMNRVQSLLCVMCLLSFIAVVFVTCFGGYIINILFGAEYIESAAILKIHILGGVFVAIGVVGNSWYMAEDLQKMIFSRTVVGSVINVVLNFIIIPKYGVIGSAATTVISFAFSGYILDFFSIKTRKLFLAKTRAIFIAPYWLVKHYETKTSKNLS